MMSHFIAACDPVLREVAPNEMIFHKVVGNVPIQILEHIVESSDTQSNA